MFILVIAFIGILLVTFGIVAFTMRSTPEQKAVERRLAVIKSSGEGSTITGTELDQLLKATEESSFGWLDDLIHTYQITHRVQLLILQADSKTTVGKLVLSSIGIGLTGLIACYIFAPIPAVAAVVGIAFSYAPIGMLSVRRSRRIAAFNVALPDAVDMMARALRAGHSLVASLSIVAEQAAEPARTEFGEVFKKQNYGLPLRDALMQLLDRIPSHDLRVMVTAILVQKDTGGNLAEILDRTVHVIRERLRIQGEIRIHTAQGRMTGWILCMLPIVMLFLINIINPGYSKVLLTDDFGRKLLYTGVILLSVGGLLIRQIVNGIEV